MEITAEKLVNDLKNYNVDEKLLNICQLSVIQSKN